MGKLIVFEGIDGSGKSTQFRMMCERFEKQGVDFRRLVFPQYSEPSSALIRMYLGGEFGSDPNSVNAYAASTFYAVDRYASFVKVWRDYYNGGGIILADRYTTSNAIHQGSKIDEENRDGFFKWLYEFEYTLIGLPEPDIVLYMDVPIDVAISQLRSRERAQNTSADIHEADTEYLRKCCRSGDDAADYYGWHKVRCTDDGKMRKMEDIHESIYNTIMGKL